MIKIENTARTICRFVLLFASMFCVAIAANAGEFKSRFAPLDDFKVHYEIGGKGKRALVFVHGWASNATFWQAQTAAFTDFRVIAIDLPGHGESDKPRVDYTMDLFARAIAAVLKDAKIERAVFVGHSMGTPVVRQFYRLHPQKVQAFVIVDGPLRPFASEATWKRMFAPLGENYKENAPQYARILTNPATPPAAIEKLVGTMLATPDYVAISAMDGMASAKNWTDDKINVPVLAIMAKTPPLWKEDTERTFRELAPNLEFEAWTDVSHMLMMEQPERFNKRLRAFLIANKFAKK